MTSPWPPVGPLLVPEGLIFALMVAGNTYIVIKLFPRNGSRATLADFTFLLGLLLMALGLWASLVYAAIDPGSASEISVFIALNSMMAVVGCWMLALFLRAEKRFPDPSGWTWPAVFTALFLGNEFLMGGAFLLLQTGPAGFQAAGWTGLAAASAAAVGSMWFFFAMFANMLAFVLWLPLDRSSRVALLAFSLSALVGPWLLTDALAGGVAMGALMAVVLVGFLRSHRAGPLGLTYARTLFLVSVAFGGMTLGEVAYLNLAAPVAAASAFALATITAMGIEILALTRWGLSARVAAPVPDAGRPAPGPTPSVPKPVGES